jgi:hypothetical protein
LISSQIGSFKLEVILISYDFKDIPKYLTPTIETQLSRTKAVLSVHVIQAAGHY